MKNYLQKAKVKIAIYRLNKKIQEFNEIVNFFSNSVVEYDKSMRSKIKTIDGSIPKEFTNKSQKGNNF